MSKSASSKILALSGAVGGATPTLLSQDVLERSFPGYNFIQGFFSTWLKLDLSKLAAAFVILSAAAGGLQAVLPAIYRCIVRFFTASVSIAADDRLNKEVLNWLGANVLPRQNTRLLNAKSEAIRDDSWSSYRRSNTSRNDLNHERRVPVQYFPTYGTTWFIHDWHVFMVRRCPSVGMLIQGQTQPDEYSTAPEGEEPIVILCLGRSAAPIKRFLDTCRDFADKQKETFTTVRATKSRYGVESWDTTILRPIRPLETVHFDEGTKAELVADIQNYLDPATRKFYTARGIPYRRGYLLHGPPGTGKTSLSLALAGKFNLELYLLHVPSMPSDSELEKLFTSLPPKCIVLLEDIDAVGMERDETVLKEKKRTSSYGGSREGCTLSGLLNVLDGVASQEGRIVLMTSNFADKLDRALVRPGRIDRMIFLGHISQKSAELMFLRMYSHDDPVYNHQGAEPSEQLEQSLGGASRQISEQQLRDLAVDFSSQIPEEKFTPAQIQGFLLSHRNAPASAASSINIFIRDTLEQQKEQELRVKEAEEKERKRKEKKSARIMRRVIAGSSTSESSNDDSDSASDTSGSDTMSDVSSVSSELERLENEVGKEKLDEEEKDKETQSISRPEDKDQEGTNANLDTSKGTKDNDEEENERQDKDKSVSAVEENGPSMPKRGDRKSRDEAAKKNRKKQRKPSLERDRNARRLRHPRRHHD